ncbi:hypothetical protein V8G54_010899 [Vigna mungo]|uniref:Uncharacterized protein n=1 Tax=Vigna mungo TaxID=3915 RepID=A0AAQ3P028_VIGMU
MKVSDSLEAIARVLVRQIWDCGPGFEYSVLEVLTSEDDQIVFRNILSRVGFHLIYGDNPSQPQVTLRKKLQMDVVGIAGVLTDLHVYHDDPAKVKCLLLPTKLFGRRNGKKATKVDESSPSLMNLLMGDQFL